MQSKRKIWMVVDHPQQFAIALGMMAGLGRDRYDYNLLVSPHHYWKKVDINDYRQQFEDIHFFERPDYTWNPARLVKMVWQIQSVKRKLSRLNIQPQDIIMGFSIFHYLENTLLSTHPRNFKMAVMPLVVYDECKRYLDPEIYYTPPEGLATGWLVEPITGLYRTYCMRERLNPHTYWRIRYRREITEIFNRVVVLGRFGQETALEEKGVLCMPYPYVLAASKSGAKAGAALKVVFFGTDFRNGMWNITPEVYAQHENRCLSFLREQYGGKYRLVYRPHPAEKNETDYLDLSQFEIEGDGKMAELYFYDNMDSIHSVFSVESTSSRSAFDFFLNSYCFLNVFPYSESARRHFSQTMGNVPEEFFINNLSCTPIPYVKHEDVELATKKCRDVLAKLAPGSEAVEAS